MSILDRRSSPRFPFHSRGSLYINGQERTGTVIDISLGGALFAIDLPLADTLGQTCELTVQQNRDPGFLEINGIIAHHHENLIGIEFFQVDETIRNGILQIIEMNLGVANLLDRDLPALLKRVPSPQATPLR